MDLLFEEVKLKEASEEASPLIILFPGNQPSFLLLFRQQEHSHKFLWLLLFVLINVSTSRIDSPFLFHHVELRQTHPSTMGIIS